MKDLFTDLYHQQSALEVAYLFPFGFDMNSLTEARLQYTKSICHNFELL